jgi:hypothetical protein
MTCTDQIAMRSLWQSLEVGRQRGCATSARYSTREQSIGGTVKPLLRTPGGTEMPDQFTGRAVDVDPFEIVKFLAGGIENLRADHDADQHALTVEQVAVHDQPPLGLVANAALIGGK